MLVVIIVGGIAMAFNAMVILRKFTTGRELDGFIDSMVFIGFSWLGSGTLAGVSIAMLASAIFSVYLYFNPISADREEDPTF